MSCTVAAPAREARAALPHVLMMALMVPMLVAHRPAVLLGTLVALLLASAAIAVCARLGVPCHETLADYLIMVALVAIGLFAHSPGGHHGAAGPALTPLWLLDTMIIAGWMLARSVALRRSTPAQRPRLIGHALLMGAQIAVMLIWCR